MLENSYCEQLVLVVSEDWEAQDAQLYCFDKQDKHWHLVMGPMPVKIGQTGMAWGIGLHPTQQGLTKVEGDKKTPAGIFEFGPAFGYLPKVNTHMPYRAMQQGMYCIDNSTSDYYNQIVDQLALDEPVESLSSEPMRRDIHFKDDMYKKGLFVKHNPHNEPDAGSCIFMHLLNREGAATAGCTAMSEGNMDKLLAWLDERCGPLMVALPKAEYADKQLDWTLPNID